MSDLNNNFVVAVTPHGQLQQLPPLKTKSHFWFGFTVGLLGLVAIIAVSHFWSSGRMGTDHTGEQFEFAELTTTPSALTTTLFNQTGGILRARQVLASSTTVNEQIVGSMMNYPMVTNTNRSLIAGIGVNDQNDQILWYLPSLVKLKPSRQILTNPADATVQAIFAVAPDGNHIAYLGSHNQIWIFTIDTQKFQQITADQLKSGQKNLDELFQPTALTWSNDSQNLYLTRRYDRALYRYQPANQSIQRIALPVANVQTTTWFDQINTLAISPDNHTLAYATLGNDSRGGATLNLYDLTNQTTQQIDLLVGSTGTTMVFDHLQWSPTGKMIGYVTNGLINHQMDIGPSQQIALYDINQHQVIQLSETLAKMDASLVSTMSWIWSSDNTLVFVENHRQVSGFTFGQVIDTKIHATDNWLTMYSLPKHQKSIIRKAEGLNLVTQ